MQVVHGILRQFVCRIGHESAYDLVHLSQKKAKITFPLIRTIHVYTRYCRQLGTTCTPMLQALFIFWANDLVGKCLSGEMSFWANVFLGKCPFWQTSSGPILSGQMSFWANVLLGKCLSGQMSFWANVLWANVFLGRCLSGQMSSGQTFYGQMTIWANVFLGKYLLGKCLLGK
jgi:hypothetical protein